MFWKRNHFNIFFFLYYLSLSSSFHFTHKYHHGEFSCVLWSQMHRGILFLPLIGICICCDICYHYTKGLINTKICCNSTMYENHFDNVQFFLRSVIPRPYLAFNLGTFRLQWYMENETETDKKNSTLDLIPYRCVFFWHNISFASCDCCVSFTLVPSGGCCVLDSFFLSLCMFWGCFFFVAFLFILHINRTVCKIVCKTKYLKIRITTQKVRETHISIHYII